MRSGEGAVGRKGQGWCCLPVYVACERASTAPTLQRSARIRVLGLDAHRTLSICIHVSVEEVEADIPSGSAIGIGVTSVLLETWCAYELQWVVYEPITPAVWAQVVGHLRGYLGSLWVSGALQGDNALEAFFVTCDQSTMTPEDIHTGHLICTRWSRARDAW